MPYVRGVTYKIGRILKQHNIKTTYKPTETIRNLLNALKDKIKLENQGIYKIPCRNCNEAYVCQTNRRISVRIEESMKVIS